LISFYALGFTDPTAVGKDWGGVRELAAHYVQLISKEQRHGPYFLGGYSYGGLVAYEMASLLTEQKQRVEFVAMIDTFPWYPRSRTVSNRLVSMVADEHFQLRQIQVRVKRSHWNDKIAITWPIQSRIVRKTTHSGYEMKYLFPVSIGLNRM